MNQATLSSGSYTAKSIISSAQRCVNVYPEKNEPSAAAPYTYYDRYGLKALIEAGTNPARGAYRATNGDLYELVGPFLIWTDSNFVRHGLGSIAVGTTPGSMSDNGTVLVLVDGTSAGYVVDLATHVMSTITDAAFYGSPRVEYMDTYFVFSRPDTTQFYLSPPLWNGTDPFDALEIANKIGGADNLQCAAANAGNIQLIGLLTTEIWYNAQGADFTFARVPSVFIEHGTPAVYSVCQNDVGTFFLSQDDDGGNIFLKIVGYEAKRFSTHAIEAEISTYPMVSDCIGQTYEYEGHAFVKFTFPTADKCWVWDESQQLWHEETWTDSDGIEHAHRGYFAAFAYSTLVMQDWENGGLYAQDVNTSIDDAIGGQGPAPIVRRRGFPHLLNDGKRVIYNKFVADMSVATAPGLLTTQEPLMSLRWSDTRGATWNDPVSTGIGATGQYDRWATFWQLGMAQDRVFELFWSAPYKTALQGAYIDMTPCAT